MNGAQPFVYLAPCGCVFSQAGLKAVSGTPPSKSPSADGADKDGDKGADSALDLCPNCGTKYDYSDTSLHMPQQLACCRRDRGLVSCAISASAILI